MKPFLEFTINRMTCKPRANGTAIKLHSLCLPPFAGELTRREQPLLSSRSITLSMSIV